MATTGPERKKTEDLRPAETGGRGAAGPPLQAERGQRRRQRKPGGRLRRGRGRWKRPRADRRPLRRHYDRRRIRAAPDFVFSALTPDEHRSLMEWPDAPRLFEHLRDVPGPLRVPDLAAFAASLGFSFDLVPPTTFEVTWVLRRGVRVGHFFLDRNEGTRLFTDENGEILVLFAWRAATAITNARTYRAERRAPRRPRGPREHLAGGRRGCPEERGSPSGGPRHPVAHLALVDDVGGVGGGGAQLPAQPLQIGSHQPPVGLVLPAPHPAQQILVRRHLSRVHGERGQQLGFRGRQRHRAAPHGHAAFPVADGQLAKLIAGNGRSSRARS